jgi:hypothetical protein
VALRTNTIALRRKTIALRTEMIALGMNMRRNSIPVDLVRAAHPAFPAEGTGDGSPISGTGH